MIGELFDSAHVFAGLRRNHYRAIMIDPPTRFVAGTKSRPQHYPRMSDTEIALLPVWDLMHPDGCWLMLWVTSPKLYRPFGSRTRLRPDELAARWGCRYSARGWLWIKLRKGVGGVMGGRGHFAISDLHRGLGLTTGKNAEDCLLFRRGKPKVKSRAGFEVIISPRREHSRKPDEIYDQIEKFADGPYLELFARQPARAGWEAWGNEVNLFNDMLTERKAA